MSKDFRGASGLPELQHAVHVPMFSFILTSLYYGRPM